MISEARVVHALGEIALFKVGDRVKVGTRAPIGHYRVPAHIRGKGGIVEFIISPAAVDNEEEGCGRNAGFKAHYYRISFLLADIWPVYRR